MCSRQWQSGGPDLSRADVNRMMEQIKQRNLRAQLMRGAVVAEPFRDRLALTVIVTRGAAAGGTGGS